MDYIEREFTVGTVPAALLTMDGLVSKQHITLSILNPLMRAKIPTDNGKETLLRMNEKFNIFRIQFVKCFHAEREGINGKGKTDPPSAFKKLQSGYLVPAQVEVSAFWSNFESAARCGFCMDIAAGLPVIVRLKA